MKISLSLTMFDQKHWTKEKRQVTILINRYYIAIDSDSKYLRTFDHCLEQKHMEQIRRNLRKKVRRGTSKKIQSITYNILAFRERKCIHRVQFSTIRRWTRANFVCVAYEYAAVHK